MAFHATSVCSSGGDDDEGSMDKMSELFGPGHVDQAVRSAIQACWMSLPKERRSVEAVEQEIRRITERALTSFRDDAVAFGRADRIIPEPPGDGRS